MGNRYDFFFLPDLPALFFGAGEAALFFVASDFPALGNGGMMSDPSSFVDAAAALLAGAAVSDVAGEAAGP